MKRFIISEEERNNILSMHANLGYKTELNEQATAQAPAQTTKPKEALNPYFQSDQIGVQINSKNPAFAKWVTDSQIQPYKSKFQLTKWDNGDVITALGTNGRTYNLNLRYFTTPEAFVGATARASELRKQLMTKVNELNQSPAPNASLEGSYISNYNCFTKDGAVTPNNSNRNCTEVHKEYRRYRNEIGLNSAEQQAQFEQFAQVAPKITPKTTG